MSTNNHAKVAADQLGLGVSRQQLPECAGEFGLQCALRDAPAASVIFK
jgi:hypothetical protein